VTETFLDLGPQSKTYPSAEVTTNVARKWKFYVINIALPIMSFSLLSILLPLCLPQADGASRLGVTLSLVITAAAYKFTIASMLPPVAYMTLIDKYVVSCSFVLILCAIQNGIMSLPVPDHIINVSEAGPAPLYYSKTSDLISAAGILFIWSVLHIYYAASMGLTLRKRNRRMNDEPQAHEDEQAHHPKADPKPSNAAAASSRSQAASAPQLNAALPSSPELKC